MSRDENLDDVVTAAELLDFEHIVAYTTEKGELFIKNMKINKVLLKQNLFFESNERIIKIIHTKTGDRSKMIFMTSDKLVIYDLFRT